MEIYEKRIDVSTKNKNNAIFTIQNMIYESNFIHFPNIYQSLSIFQVFYDVNWSTGLIGRGGFAEVYLGRCYRTGKTVAIKRVK